MTGQALFIDGANGICRDARLGDASPARALFLLLAGALVAAWWLGPARIAARRRAWVLVAVGMGAALPGWAAWVALRADGPMRAEHTAAEVTRLGGTLRTFAQARGCAQVRLDHCLTCAPVARLAVAGLRCETPAGLELHEDAWTGPCSVKADALVCGDGAR